MNATQRNNIISQRTYVGNCNENTINDRKLDATASIITFVVFTANFKND